MGKCLKMCKPISYAIVAWLLIQIVSTVFPMSQLPGWTMIYVTVLLMIGFQKRIS
ncbi:hypothetical protein ACFL7M_16800 [Thermodesulfobacteriota bacterium]